MSTKSTSTKPNKRKAPTDNINTKLFAEVDGICPKCSLPLMYEVNGQNYKQFEVAHIYPLNPTSKEKELLKHELRLSSDVNHIDNLIALCEVCHGKFDKPRTIEGYRKIYDIKKKLTDKRKSLESWSQHNIEEEINQIINYLALDSNIEIEIDPSFTPKTIDSKTDVTLQAATKRQIKIHVASYFKLIQLKFKEQEAIKPRTSEIISNQVKIFYYKCFQINQSQEFIYNALVDWLYKKTNNLSREASSIVISFFVQNCEVFE